MQSDRQIFTVAYPLTAIILSLWCVFIKTHIRGFDRSWPFLKAFDIHNMDAETLRRFGSELN